MAAKLLRNRFVPLNKSSGIRNGQAVRKLNFAVGIWRFSSTNLGHSSDFFFLTFQPDGVQPREFIYFWLREKSKESTLPNL